MDDIIFNKCERIEKCVDRIKKTYYGNEKKLLTDYDVQDIVILNLQRACKTAIDAAIHIIKIKKLGIPKDGHEAFMLLAKNNLIPKKLSQQLVNMVSFRSAIICEYTEIDYNIVKNFVAKEINSLTAFAQTLLSLEIT